MAFKFSKPKNYAKLEKMSDAALAKYFNKQKPLYRRAIAKLTSLLKLFFGRVFKATAADDVISVSGGEGAIEVSGGNGKAGTHGLIVEKFKAPGKRALKGYIDALGTIDFINVLQYEMERAAKSEDKTLRSEVKEIERMRNALIEGYTNAMEAMETVAQKHIPDAAGALFQGAQEIAKSLLPDDFEFYNYVFVGVEGDEADFVLNMDLTEDEDKKSLVVVTARLVPKDDRFEIRCYINHLDVMALPGMYNVGTPIDGTDVKSILKKMKPAIEHEISMTHVIGLLGAIAIPIDETKIEKKLSEIDGVTGVSFEYDDEDGVSEIHFEVPGISTGDEVAKSARAAAFRVVSSDTKVKAMLRKQYSLNLVNDDDHCTLTLTHKG